MDLWYGVWLVSNPNVRCPSYHSSLMQALNEIPTQVPRYKSRIKNMFYSYLGILFPGVLIGDFTVY